MKGEIRWDKFCKHISGVRFSDQTVLNVLASLPKRFNWVDIIPIGLRTSYVSLKLFILN